MNLEHRDREREEGGGERHSYEMAISRCDGTGYYNDIQYYWSNLNSFAPILRYFGIDTFDLILWKYRQFLAIIATYVYRLRTYYRDTAQEWQYIFFDVKYVLLLPLIICIFIMCNTQHSFVYSNLEIGFQLSAMFTFSLLYCKIRRISNSSIVDIFFSLIVCG